MERTPSGTLTPPRRARCLSLFSHTECSRVHDTQAQWVRMCACACARSSLFLLVTDAVRRPLPSVRIPSAIRGVTASFGWVRAKETDENRAGMRETRSREGAGGPGGWGGQGGRGEEEFVKSLPEVSAPCDFASAGSAVFLLRSVPAELSDSYKYFALIDHDRRVDQQQTYRAHL